MGWTGVTKRNDIEGKATETMLSFPPGAALFGTLEIAGK